MEIDGGGGQFDSLPRMSWDPGTSALLGLNFIKFYNYLFKEVQFHL